MKTFKNYITQDTKKPHKTNDHNGFFIDKHGYANPSKPITIHKKIKKKEIKENKINGLGVLPGIQGSSFSNHEDQLEELSDTLHSKQKKLTQKQIDHIKAYTNGNSIGGIESRELNNKLIENHKKSKYPTEGMSPKHKAIHETISKLASQPIGHHVHLYSGVGFDPREAAEKSKNKIIHLPAHMSTSHDLYTATNFADMSAERDVTPERHIIHIEAKPTDKGFHVGNHSEIPDEYETIIPAGTKLKYSHTTTHTDGKTGPTYHVHHFTIHSQE